MTSPASPQKSPRGNQIQITAMTTARPRIPMTTAEADGT